MTPRARTIGRIAGRIVVALIAAFCFSALIIMLFEEKFIYFPSRYPDGLYDEAGRAGIAEDCYLTTEDGVRLHGWMFRHAAPKATILLLHGNAGNVSHRHALCVAYRGMGYNVFIIDYRGYGRSDGEPSEEGLYADARAAYRYVTERDDAGTVPVVIFGSSLGGAVAVELALGRPVAALILEATFTSAADMADTHYPFLPVRMFMKTGLNSVEKIPRIASPVLFIHGEEDGIVPIALGRRLHEAAREPKEFIAIPGAGHNDLLHTGGSRYLEAIDNFISHRLEENERPRTP